jgi:hypothetical protein
MWSVVWFYWWERLTIFYSGRYRAKFDILTWGFGKGRVLA